MTDKALMLDRPGELTPSADKYSGTFMDRFWSKVDRGSEGECWEWLGGKAGRGYGVIGTSDYSIPKPERQAYAHRCSWEIHNGPIPDGLCVLHDCPGGDNPGCVNPDHLFLGTQLDNVRDMVRKGRQRTVGLKGSKNGRAKLTADDIREIRRRHKDGESQNQIAPDYGVNQSHVWRIVSRESWSHAE